MLWNIMSDTLDPEPPLLIVKQEPGFSPSKLPAVVFKSMNASLVDEIILIGLLIAKSNLTLSWL